MTTSDSKRNPNEAGKTRGTPTTRRGRLPGPEAGFGRRLRLARGIQKQADVAARAQVARSAYARYERGDRFPSVPELRRLCEALSVTPEHLIFGDTSPGFTPSPSPIAAVAPSGDTEKEKIARHLLTSILLNALPKNEGDAFRELIRVSSSLHLRDQPEVLNAVTQLCTTLIEGSWDDVEALVSEKLETDPAVREFVDSLSDEQDQDA